VITASKNDYGSRIKIKRRDQEKRSREEIRLSSRLKKGITDSIRAELFDVVLMVI